jgi:hypothetical protein
MKSRKKNPFTADSLRVIDRWVSGALWNPNPSKACFQAKKCDSREGKPHRDKEKLRPPKPEISL